MTNDAGAVQAEDGRQETAPLRSPWLPCALAWSVPGMGHVLLGRRVQGVVFLLLVLITFGSGLALDGTVYAMDREQPLTHLSTLANIGVGPLDWLARWRTYGELRYTIPSTRVDQRGREQILDRLREKVASSTHTYGRTFLLTAGLMNLLLVLDVFDYCIGRKPRPGKSRQESGEQPA